jgi:hypothetical protein
VRQSCCKIVSRCAVTAGLPPLGKPGQHPVGMVRHGCMPPGGKSMTVVGWQLRTLTRPSRQSGGVNVMPGLGQGGQSAPGSGGSLGQGSSDAPGAPSQSLHPGSTGASFDPSPSQSVPQAGDDPPHPEDSHGSGTPSPSPSSEGQLSGTPSSSQSELPGEDGSLSGLSGSSCILSGTPSPLQSSSGSGVGGPQGGPLGPSGKGVQFPVF